MNTPDNEQVPGPMFLTPNSNFVVIDIETFGLDYMNDEPIEVGLAVCDLDLNILEKGSWLLWDEWYEDKWTTELPNLVANGYEKEYGPVIKMHTDSGLIEDARENGEAINVVHRRMLDWLVDQGFQFDKTMPMTGSSVNFDRMITYFNFREFYNAFHYRVIDVSTLKILAGMYSPEIEVLKKNALTPRKKHRVLDDIEDTVDELAFYVDHFLKTER